MAYFIGLIILLFSGNLSAAALKEEKTLAQLAAQAQFDLFQQQSVPIQETLRMGVPTPFGYALRPADDPNIILFGLDRHLVGLADLRNLYHFLAENHFFGKVGRFGLKRLFAEGSKGNADLRKLAKFIKKTFEDEDREVGEKDCLDYIVHDDFIGKKNIKYFHSISPTLIIRTNKPVDPKLSSIDKSLRPLFQRDREAAELLKQAGKIFSVIDGKLQKIKTIIDRQDDQQKILDALLESDDFPSLLKPMFKKRLFKHQRIAQSVEEIKKSLDEALQQNALRREAFNTYFPSSLNVALIYSSFFIEKVLSDASDQPLGLPDAYGASDDRLQDNFI